MKHKFNSINLYLVHFIRASCIDNLLLQFARMFPSFPDGLAEIAHFALMMRYLS